MRSNIAHSTAFRRNEPRSPSTGLAQFPTSPVAPHTPLSDFPQDPSRCQRTAVAHHAHLVRMDKIVLCHRGLAKTTCRILRDFRQAFARSRTHVGFPTSPFAPHTPLVGFPTSPFAPHGPLSDFRQAPSRRT